MVCAPVCKETRESKERMMAPFLDVLDLKGDPASQLHNSFCLVARGGCR